MEPSHLIVLEGVDGAGTTTQARLLVEQLRARQVPAHQTAEPSAGPVGAMLRQALAGRVILNGGSGPSWTTMALLFAADRLDHLDSEVLPNLRDGVSVICDRYYHSSIAYQSATGGGAETVAWLRELNRHARKPDLTLVLDVPPTVARERRRQRRGAAELFDDDELQARLCEIYASIERHVPDELVVHVDGSASVDEVARSVFAEVEALRGRG